MQTHSKHVDETTPLTVYYDGECPLCTKEIGWYQKQKGADSIEWCDVSQSGEDTVAPDLCTTDALRRFHVRKSDGSLVNGASAFSELWSYLPRFKLLGAFSKLPLITQLAEVLYRVFLKIRPSIQRLMKQV